jgi:NAD-dependent SIR2 family protein deacetylase
LQANTISGTDPTATAKLAEFIGLRQSLAVITGAGCSTASGIPDYRDSQGEWKRRQPMTYQEFVGSEAGRRHYWGRSLLGYRHIAGAKTNAAHESLAKLEAQGRIATLITQNVDRLHQAAGSRAVIDLHGRIDRVICLQCHAVSPRDEFQHRLQALNPDWHHLDADVAPDGDAELETVDFNDFRVPDCPVCGGVVKPDVVFFGESVPKQRVLTAMAAVDQADGLLAIGTSLMVFSGFRFVRRAAQNGLPIVIVNQGQTRGDNLATTKFETACETLLADAAHCLENAA